MTKAKGKSFEEIAENLEAEHGPPPPAGTVPNVMRPTAVGTEGPSLSEVMGKLGVTGEVFNTDTETLFERNSSQRCAEHQIGLPEEQQLQQREYVQAAVALSNPVIKNHENPGTLDYMKQLAEKAKALPKPDFTTYVDGEKITLSAQTRTVPAGIPREAACELLEALLQSKPQVIEILSCARTAGPGFIKEPHVWLSQQVALEANKSELWDKLPKGMPFVEAADGDLQAGAPDAIARLFGTDTARALSRAARVNDVSILYVFRYIVDKVCRARRAVVKPPAEAGSKYLDIIPTQQ